MNSFLPEGESEPNNPILNFPDFITHSNYLQCLEKFSKEIRLECKQSENKVIVTRDLQSKLKLISLTRDNLIQEFKIVRSFHEYSIICSSWIPVKSYYLIFNCLLILGYLMSGDERYFRKNHGDVSKDFKKMLINKEVVFSESVFNKCVGGNIIESWKIPKSENLKKHNPNLNLRLKQIIRMIYFYVKDDYKKTREIKTLSRKKLIDFRNGVSVCLFDFFYWYRIKANYRDMEFIDEGVPTNNFFQYYQSYFQTTMNFYSAFSEEINRIATDKLGRQLL